MFSCRYFKAGTICPWIECWGINLNPARNHGRRHLDWGHGDSDQLWLRINLCSALIGCLSELAFTERCHWPTSSTDLYHRSGSHFVSNPGGKHKDVPWKEVHWTMFYIPNGCGHFFVLGFESGEAVLASDLESLQRQAIQCCSYLGQL